MKTLKRVIFGAIGISLFSTGVYAGTVIDQYKTPRGNIVTVEEEQVHKNRIGITVNGEKIEKDTWYVNQTTYIPLREISELLGAKVNYNSTTWSADIVTPKEKDESMEPVEKEEEKETVIEIEDKENDEQKEEEIELEDIDNYDDLINYLNENYRELDTPMGKTTFEFDYHENDLDFIPYDLKLEVDFDISFFSDIANSIKYDEETKDEVKEMLKEHQEDIANDVIQAFPGKKIYGGYHKSWYRYPNLRVDLITRQYFTWKNFDGEIIDDYEDTEVSEFMWDNSIDDEL